VLFGGDFGVFFRFRQGGHPFGYDRPVPGQLGVDLDKLALILGHVFLGVDGVDRTFRYAYRAVDTFVGIYDQEVRTLFETVYRTHIYAVGIAAFDT
jgi:hypothetical protein